MLFSKSFLPTLREEPKGAECTSHRLSLKGSLLFMVSSGIYAYLPFGFRVLRKIENIIRKRMNETGAQEILMSALQPLEIWKQTGRDKDLEEVMITFKDRRGRQLCLGPTHEEEVTEIVKRYVSSYKQLPFTLYQIQTKFRDEARPRYGLVRSCEFIMKDAYSFDIDDRGLNFSYEVMFNAYKKIFKDCGLEFVTVEADPGAMGGNISHEFMVPADIGEDTLYFCKDCNLYFKKEGKCEKCGRKLKEEKMIEVGHVFKLGTKYSKAQEAYFLDKDGLRKPIVMGCYGIGVSVIISAIIEQNHD
ncbi:MAG: proline--tRNA ligase, partial [Candidatus Omnitrophica bacterium]|nr:proline--tRNA ligase [Candidatus Omnitrophota bacterium]